MSDQVAQPKKFKTNYSFLHGEYKILDEDSDAYVGFLKDVDTGELKMQVVDNPVVNIWVTSVHNRNHSQKKEWAPKTELDEYTTRYLKRGETIWNALNNYGPGSRYRHMQYVNLRKEMTSPYVYGADIDFGVRMKHRIQLQNGDRKPLDYKVGHLDIETDVNGTYQIILITFMNWDGNTYTGILREFLKGHSEQEVSDLWYKDVEQKFRSQLNKKGIEAYDGNAPIQLHVKAFDGEVELIKWIFDNIHNCRPDFVTIWNMGFDIPYILDRLKFRKVDPTDIFCSEDIPRKYRTCKFKLDTSGEHITDNWSWLHCTDYTRFIDAMCCYGRLRKAKGRDPSYTLNAICEKEIGAGKLHIDDRQTMDHHIAQKEFPVEYSVYNIVDVALMRVLENKNHDIRTMNLLIGDSMLEEFSKQSAQLKNMFFVHLESKGGVPASVGGSLEVPWDKYQTNKGGQVLSPDLTNGTGVSILIDSMVVAYVHKLVCDIDVSSIKFSRLAARVANKNTFNCWEV